MNSQLDALLRIPNLLYDISLVLKNQTAGELWVLVPKLQQIMTEATAHVDEKSSFGTESLAKSLLYGVETLVTPAVLSLAISAHVIIELFCVLWTLGKPEKERILRFVCELEGTVSNVSWVLIAGLLQVSRDGVERRSSNIVASGD